jgi:hypothetical protein
MVNPPPRGREIVRNLLSRLLGKDNCFVNDAPAPPLSLRGAGHSFGKAGDVVISGFCSYLLLDAQAYMDIIIA